MNDSLPQLEAQKSELLRQLATVGDLRRGSITATSGKCGKPNCHCAKRGDVGHGPNFRLTRRVAGKTTTETFACPAALRKAILAQDKATLETLAAEQLSYSHSDAHLEDKTKFINAIMTRKAVFKSLEFPELTVAIVGNNAIVRHLWVSESELDGKITNTKIGVLQVWQKQDSRWKLLARASFRLPQSA